MANYPQTLADLQGYVSNLINDPSNTRYPLTLINSMLDLAQTRWNLECKICRQTDYSALTANTYRYNISTIATLPVIKILRVTLKGIDLRKLSKDYADMYSANDWTTSQGTPQEYMIDLNSAPPSLILHPTPQGNDVTSYTNVVGITAQNPLGVEYITPHTTMVNSTDVPFTVGGVSNPLILPYIAGLGLDVSASILEPDPTTETVSKARIFRAQADAYMSNVTQIYYDLESDEPFRLSGGRFWRS